ncbi:MAG: cation-translocating P-type ATPase [Halalkalicoccus sp.]
MTTDTDRTPEKRRDERRFSIPEMDCPSCAGKVTKSVERLDGISEVDASPTTGSLRVTYDPGVCSEDRIRERIAAAGYAVEDEGGSREASGPADPPRAILHTPRAIATLAGALLVTVGMVLHFLAPAADPHLFDLSGRAFALSHVLFVASAALAGAPILRNGYYSARNRSLDIDFLMSAGILGSVLTHHPFEGAMLAVLFSIAELLERFSMDRARGSLRELMALSPETATVLRGGREVTVPVERVAVGDRIVVRPGEKVPTDGVVREGEAAVDQSPITGESVPVEKREGSEVYAGTIDETGYLEVEATSEADDSTIARIVRLVEDAQREKTDREQFVDRLASVYTPIVVALAVLTMVGPPLLVGASWNTWFLRGLTLLVIACPCAFVISTPVSVVSGITSAARNGVLVKSGRDLEAVGETAVLAIDKTGTLTTGELSVTDAVALDGTAETAVLRRAGALERRSEHPIAGAIVEEAGESAAGEFEVSGFEALAGRGVRGDVDGVTHFVGKPALFEDRGFDLRRPAADGGRTDGGRAVATGTAVENLGGTIARLESEGKTVVLVGTDEELLGLIAIADEPRPEAAWTVSRLREAGVRVVMLTGDNEGTARTIAERIGIEEYHAGLLPEEKLERIRALESEYGRVAMVGDGINDAPALATAEVGIAMGAAGTDTALETADVALMGDDLTRLPYLYRLSRVSNGVIRQNIWSSLGVKALLALGAPFGVVTVIHAVVIGDMGMSLAVTGNAMRLSRIEPETPPDGPATNTKLDPGGGGSCC